MFGRGSWAVLGLAKEALEAFRTNLEDRALMVASSQMAASAITRHFTSDTLGINPFRAPRVDEDYVLSAEHQQEIAQFATLAPEARAEYALPPEILESKGYGAGVEQFQVHPEMPWYGLWAVSNEWKDVSDLASIKEQRSYALLERPYKFLQTTDKKSVDQETLGVTAAVRKQVPVLLDFNEGRVYIESSNKKLIEVIKERLTRFGAETIAVGWMYSLPEWPAEILNKLYEDTQYQGDFEKRAEEAKRFKANEIEKLEDRELQAIVTNYFSMTQLASEFWIGISCPAQVRLHDASPPLGVKAPTSATTLLKVTNDAKLLSGAITFQERISGTSKKGGEFTFRKDLLCIDVNDRMNLTEVGAAMLRGFDVPSFRKDLQREIRQTKQVPSIDQFWSNWLHEMGNAVRTLEGAFREILGLDGHQQGGILPMRAAVEEKTPELVEV